MPLTTVNFLEISELIIFLVTLDAWVGAMLLVRFCSFSDEPNFYGLEGKVQLHFE